MNTSWYHPVWIFFSLLVVVVMVVALKVNLRRGLQVFFGGLFAGLFSLTSFEGKPTWPVDAFLFSDPLLAVIHTLASRVVVPVLVSALIFMGLAFVMGRVFCSHVCPMGSLLDLSDHWIARRQRTKANREAFRRARKIKFILLLFFLGAALAGFNLLGFADPLVLLTRFAATLFYPVFVLLQDVGVGVARPVGEWLGWLDLAYMEVIRPIFEGALATLALFLGFLLLGRLQPRFWCRHLCPLGAGLGWLGRFAPYRRRVNEACNGCNTCVRKCPTGAIHEKGLAVDRSECIVCLQCVRVCPEKAVRFGFGSRQPETDIAGIRTGRRAVLGGLAGGLGVALGMRADLLHPTESFLPLPFRHQGLIRPPGALPEPQFLTRCVRCGQCMRACLTNTLQPDWHRAGLEGLWAPHMNLRHAACEQTCNVCGQVCPTQAIRPLSHIEKQHAKVGTAIVLRDRCLPWSQDQRCLICDEQCPYNAIVFHHDEQHQVGLPVVNAAKCNGCGQCEDKCPVVGDAAIIVSPHGELRLEQGSYVEEARALGLVFEAEDQVKDQFRLDDEIPQKDPTEGVEGAPKPHYDKDQKPELPPGIDFEG